MTKWNKAGWVALAVLASIVGRASTALAAAATSAESMPDGLNASPVQVPSAGLFALLSLLGMIGVVLLLRTHGRRDARIGPVVAFKESREPPH